MALPASFRLLFATFALVASALALTAARAEAAAGPMDPFGPLEAGLPDIPFAAAAAVPSGFEETVVKTGLEAPMAFRFAPDGRLIVAEKAGEIEVFDSLSDPTPTHLADLTQNVYDFWDRGLMGIALDPQFTSGRPFVYALYSHDAEIGATAPRWSDDCPTPPGPTGDGCLISGRLSKISPTGSEQVLIEDWCQQYMSHSVGTVAFGADGALYAGSGDGASFDFPDYGGDGNPVNPCGDPPSPVGGAMSPPSAEGGALRSQDLRTSSDPATLDGSIIRVNPDTGAAMPDNPNIASSDANVRRIIAYGLRNPFRFAFRPGTNDIFLGDVGWNDYEEINRLQSAAAPVENFGWPCYEGPNRHPSYDSLNLNICENLYAAGAGAITPPHYAYHHSAKVSTESCPTGSSSLSGAEFYDGGTFPAQYNGAFFFADYSRNCIWVMFADANGIPNPATRQPFVTGASGPVDIQVGPDGSVYYADINTGSIRRIRSLVQNNAPNAVVSANPTSGAVPLSVSFDGRGSTDPEGGTLSYAWDLDGDGAFDDSTAAQPSFTYTTTGSYTVRLRVTDPSGLSDTDQVTITAGTPPTPSIDTPAEGFTWKTGDTISFTGSATRSNGTSVPASGLTWAVIMQHCSALVPTSCHDHTITTLTGAGGSFVAPSHEYPSHLELKLTATDGGLSRTVTRRLDPKTAQLTFETQPPGLELNVGTESQAAPFTRTAIQGSNLSLIAPTPQPLGGKTYEFSSWSDGGSSAHVIQGPTTPTTYRATYNEVICAPPQGLVGGWGFDEVTGAAVNDSSGLANTGTITGATRIAEGRFGSALSFDGLNDMVTVADAPSLDLTTRATLEAWVYPTALGGSWRTALLKEQAGQLVYALYANDDFGRPAGHLFTTGDLRTGGSSTLPLNTWSHIALTWDGSTARFYLNGTQASTATVAGTLVNGAGPLRFGGNGVWSEWFAGRLDEIRVYDRALTQAELQADRDAPVTCNGSPPPTPVLGTSTGSLGFTATQGGANPASQTFQVTNTGGGTLNWSATESASWLSVTPGSGTAPSTLTASVSTAGLAAGTYTAPITISAAGASGSPKTVNVTFVVDPPPPALAVSPASLTFNATQGGANPAAQTVSVTNTGGGTLSWTATDNQTWLSVAPASGTGAGTPSVSVNTSGLAAGTYTGTVTVSATGAAGSPKTVAVTLNVNPPTPVLAVSPASLTFNATQGGANPAAQTVSVTNTGGGTLSWTATDNQTWLSVAPASGTGAGTPSVSVNTSGLAAGTHTGTVTISATGASGSPKTVAVTLNVNPATPVLSVAPASLAFTATQGGANPAAQTVNVTNTGGGTLNWTASDDQAWLSVAPTSGTGAGSPSVSANISGLAPGTYTGTVTVTATGASGSPKTVGVTLTVNPQPPAGTGPVGAWGFDETSGTGASDASGRGNNGTITGATRTTAGRFGSALTFDGVNDWVTVPDAPSLDLTTRATLEAYVYPTALGTTWRTAILKEQAGQLVYALYANNDVTRPSGHVFTTGDLFSNGTAALPLNTWSHLALTWDGATLRLYVNATQVATRALTGTLPNSALPLRFGGNGVWSEWFAGRLDEIRVYDRALTQAELQADRDRAVSGTGLAAANRAAGSRSAARSRAAERRAARAKARRKARKSARARARRNGGRRVRFRARVNPGAHPEYSGLTVHTAR